MLADWLKAAIPTPTIILGQRLQPFALGHNMILLRHGNGFLSEGDIKPGDLELGVFICCHEYDEALAAIEDPKLPELLMEWGKTCGTFDYKAKCQEFMAYIQAGSAVPELLPPDESKLGRTPGAPFLQLVKVTAQARLGYSRTEALNAPLGEVLHDYFAYYEQDGRAKIFGPDEKEHTDTALDVAKEVVAAEPGKWTVLPGVAEAMKGGNDAV